MEGTLIYLLQVMSETHPRLFTRLSTILLNDAPDEATFFPLLNYESEFGHTLNAPCALVVDDSKLDL